MTFNGTDEREVYFLRPVGMEGPIKIGCSYDPRVQLAKYLAWSPLPLEIVLTIPGTLALETNIHECFLDCHSHREWFFPHPRLLAAIAAMQAGVPVGEAIDLTDRKGRMHSVKIAQALAKRGTPQETREV